MSLIAPSILNADFLNLGSQIEMINSSRADWIHMDVMDGVYVPNISFGIPIVKAVKGITEKPLDVHLMIVDPEKFIKPFIKAGAFSLTIHYEVTTHLHRAIQEIKEEGARAGVALNPHTDVSVLKPILSDIDMVLIMTVNPGFGGQKFIENSYQKIKDLRKLSRDLNPDLQIQVDGGVSLENISSLKESGVDVFVAGTFVFKSDDPVETIGKLKEKVE